MPAKKKAAKKAKVNEDWEEMDMDLPKGANDGAVAAPVAYTVAKCQWCGMQWKHFGCETPQHTCGKLCAQNLKTSEELEDEAAAKASK